MELHELQIADARAGSPRHCQAVAGGDKDKAAELLLLLKDDLKKARAQIAKAKAYADNPKNKPKPPKPKTGLRCAMNSVTCCS